ncbi:hypothetical protein J132_08573 [Termitomyces sp. J132]|nr:hypothetical protein J132_08573 [Termitomyces sp. J132]
MEQDSDNNLDFGNDDIHSLDSYTKRLADDASIDQTHDKTTDTRVFDHPILALISHAYAADSRIDSSCVAIDTPDPATPEIYPVKFDPLIPPSSPLPPSSSPSQIFSSSSLPSSQSSTIEYPSEDLKEEVELHENTTAKCFVNPENILDVDTSTAPLSYPLTLETSSSAVTKHLPDLPTYHGLLNGDDGRRTSTDLEPPCANVELMKSNLEIPLAPLISLSSSDAKTEEIEETKADEQHVPMHEDSIVQSSPSENFSFRKEKMVSNKSEYSSKLELCTLAHVELPIVDLESKSLSKRKIEDENAAQMAVTLLKKQKINQAVGSVSSFPNPKRSTIAFQQLQHKKLISPFRSPALTLHSKPMGLKSSIPVPLLPHASTLVPEERTMTTELIQPLADDLNSKLKHRTQRASAPFKSPLSTDAITKLSTVRMTPTIQTLERKMQLLRRAIKIKDDGDEGTLLKLTKKWTEAGRDIAWEVWDLVKENLPREDRGWSSSEKPNSRTSILKDSWCWNDETNRQEKERNWGWDVEPGRMAMDVYDNEVHDTNTDDNEYKPQDTVGTMLIQLGIAPDTLGWNEEDEEFQDM